MCVKAKIGKLKLLNMSSIAGFIIVLQTGFLYFLLLLRDRPSFFLFSLFSSFFPPIHHHSLSFLFFLLFLPIPPTPFPRSPPPPCVSCNITLRSLAPLPPELSSLPFHLHLFLVPLWLCSWTSRPVRRHVTLSAADLWDLIFTLVFLLRQNSPSYRDVNFVTVSPRVRPARLGFSVGF